MASRGGTRCSSPWTCPHRSPCSSPRAIPGAVLSPGDSSVPGKETSLGLVQEPYWHRSLVSTGRIISVTSPQTRVSRASTGVPALKESVVDFPRHFPKKGPNSTLSGPAPPSIPPWWIRLFDGHHSASWLATDKAGSLTDNLINPTSHHTQKN